MKKSIFYIVIIVLVAVGIYIIFAADQAQGGMMGGSYVMRNPDSEWEAPPAQGVRQNPVAADNNSIGLGKDIFVHECSYCHGMNGRGTSLAPDLGDEYILRQTDGDLFWKISEGKSPMPGFANILTERERWDVVNYIRTLASALRPGISTTMQTGMGTGISNSSMVRDIMMNSRVIMMDSMNRMMSNNSIIATPDGGVILLMGNELLEYDSDLNPVKQVDINFDWNNWQKTIVQSYVTIAGATQ